jgi:hypothetical protein
MAINGIKPQGKQWFLYKDLYLNRPPALSCRPNFLNNTFIHVRLLVHFKLFLNGSSVRRLRSGLPYGMMGAATADKDSAEH